MSPLSHPAPTTEEIESFQTATRDLIGVALHSLESLDGHVSLPQFRVLWVLGELGTSPSSRVAEALGVAASSVTRLADRLVASDHLRRGRDPGSRSVVTLELTDRGQQVVTEVLGWRHRELARLLSQLDETERAATAAGLRTLHQVVQRTDPAPQHGPVPL